MSPQPDAVAPTPLQDALWWIGQRTKDMSVYNITWRLAADRPIDVVALRAAYQQLTDRHDALRMSLGRGDTTLELVVAPHIDALVRLIEIDDPGATPPGTLFLTIAEEVHGQAIPLDRAPLVSLFVVRVAERYELLVVGHHAAIDGWALTVLLGELSQAYEALVQGRRYEFPTAAPQFRAYAQEQAQGQVEERWHDSLVHWQNALSGATAVTVRPDRDQPAAVGSAGTTVQYDFSPQAVRGLTSSALRAGTTPFAVMLAALQIVLARGGAGPDVTVGVVTANRMTKRDQELVGYLANVCLARSSITAEDSVADVIGRARDNLWGIVRHQAAAYPMVFAALPAAVQTELGGTAPVLLNYLGSVVDQQLGPVRLSLRPSPTRTARTDLALTYWDGDGVLVSEVEYSTIRYDRSSILALLRDLDGVLSTGAQEAQIAVGSLRLATQSVRRRPSAGADSTAGTSGSESAAFGLVSEVWTELLGQAPGDLDDDFFACGGHSLNAVLFVAALAERAGVSLDLAAWLAAPTAGHILRQLIGSERPDSAPSPSTLVPIAEGSARHLHLIGGAGGTPNDFRELLLALPGDWRVTWSQEREPLDSLPEMARRYRNDLDAAGLRPDIICGWAVGGVIGYEMLVHYGGTPPALVLIDAAAPTGQQIGAEALHQELQAFVAMVCSSLGRPARGAMPAVSEDEASSLLGLAARLRAEGYGVSADVLFDRWASYLRQARAGASYLSEAVVPAPAVLIDAELTAADVTGWHARLRPAPHTIRIDTDHFGVLRGEQVRQVAAAIAHL